MSSFSRWVVALLPLLVVLVACGGGDAAGPTSATAANDTTVDPPIASEWRARCGGCHVRVEPHSRERAYVTTALSRHRKRAHLSEEQWAALVDYLAR